MNKHVVATAKDFNIRIPGKLTGRARVTNFGILEVEVDFGLKNGPSFVVMSRLGTKNGFSFEGSDGDLKVDVQLILDEEPTT
jgi:hypothetical protein